MNYDSDDVTMMLRNVAMMLALIPTADLEAHVKSCRDSLNRADTWGVMIDPTGWMRSRDSGRTEDAINQLKIAEGLLAARKAIDVREAFVAKKGQGE